MFRNTEPEPSALKSKEQHWIHWSPFFPSSRTDIIFYGTQYPIEGQTLYCVETILVLLRVCTPMEDLITGSSLLGSICSSLNLHAFPVLKCLNTLTSSSCSESPLAHGWDANIFSVKCSAVPVSDSSLLLHVHCFQDVALLQTVKGSAEAKYLQKSHPNNASCILRRRDLSS